MIFSMNKLTQFAGTRTFGTPTNFSKICSNTKLIEFKLCCFTNSLKLKLHRKLKHNSFLIFVLGTRITFFNLGLTIEDVKVLVWFQEFFLLLKVVQQSSKIKSCANNIALKVVLKSNKDGTRIQIWGAKVLCSRI